LLLALSITVRLFFPIQERRKNLYAEI